MQFASINCSKNSFIPCNNKRWIPGGSWVWLYYLGSWFWKYAQYKFLERQNGSYTERRIKEYKPRLTNQEVDILISQEEFTDDHGNVSRRIKRRLDIRLKANIRKTNESFLFEETFIHQSCLARLIQADSTKIDFRTYERNRDVHELTTERIRSRMLKNAARIWGRKRRHWIFLWSSGDNDDWSLCRRAQQDQWWDYFIPDPNPEQTRENSFAGSFSQVHIPLMR